MTWTFAATKKGYHNLWVKAEIDPKHATTAMVDALIAKGLRRRADYEAVEKLTDVPWWMILVIDMREDDFDPLAVLANGEHIIGTGRITHLVPAGLGPFANWIQGAVASLKFQHITGVKDWTIELALYALECYNGLAYANSGVMDPYLWSWSTLYSGGKVMADHQPISRGVYDKQPGCVVVLKRMVDRGIFTPKTILDSAQPAPTEPKEPPVTDPVPVPVPAPATPSLGSFLGSVLAQFGPQIAPLILKNAPAIAATIPGLAPYALLIQIAVNLEQEVVGANGNLKTIEGALSKELRLALDQLDKLAGNA